MGHRWGIWGAAVHRAWSPPPRTNDALASPPLVGLLHHPEVDECLGLANAIDRAEPFGEEPQEALVVLAYGLDEDVVGPGRDDDVVDLGHLGAAGSDLHQAVGLAADADHRHLLEPELERIGHPDDLQDAALDD